MDIDAVAAELLDTGLPVTVSGGEPFAQASAVAELLAVLRNQRPDLHIIVYSGFTFEQLCNMAAFVDGVHDILIAANVLVDGPYIAERDHPWMQWRGSDNQRPIDLDHTLGYTDESGKMITQRLAVLNWDTQQLTINDEGEIVGTAGQMCELFEETEQHRMCGETPSSQPSAFARGVVDRVMERPQPASLPGRDRSEWQRGNDRESWLSG